MGLQIYWEEKKKPKKHRLAERASERASAPMILDFASD
jgi:hypothetical protein